jgi:hypothetical protein
VDNIRRAFLTLELDPEADPIAGVVHGDAGRHEFRGWMQLTRTIELAVESARESGPSESPSSGTADRSPASDPGS